MSVTFTARALHTGDGVVPSAVITVEDGLIQTIETGAAANADASFETLTPAFFDLHVHGAKSYDFMTAGQDEVGAIGRFLATKGLSHYLATTVTGTVDATLHALERLAECVTTAATTADAATMVGINLEGPFLCPAKRGVHPVDHILAPSVETFERFQAAAAGQIRLITIAPEMPGALELIAHATAAGVRVSMGHSNATYAEGLAGIDAGAVGATHVFNAMRAIDHREPGLAMAVLGSETLYAELICDGIHVHPEMVRLWLRMKGLDRAILVSDGMSATGMPDGTYMLGDLVVQLAEGVCMSGGVLAGSVLTLDKAVENLLRFAGVELPDAVGLASRNPARMMGMDGLMTIAPGMPANFNCYDAAGKRTGSVLSGKRIAG